MTMCEETREVRRERRTIALSGTDERGSIVEMWDALVVGVPGGTRQTRWNSVSTSFSIQYVELRGSTIIEVVVEVVKGELGLSCWQSFGEEMDVEQQEGLPGSTFSSTSAVVRGLAIGDLAETRCDLFAPLFGPWHIRIRKTLGDRGK